MSEFPSIKLPSIKLTSIKLFGILAATFALSGCSLITNELTPDKAQAWYEKKNETFEDFMTAAQDASSKGHYDKAMQYYKDGRALAAVLYGESDGRIATSSDSLAHLEENAGKYADAENDYKKALAIDKKIIGWDKPETIEVRRSLAKVLLTRYKETEAKQMLSGLKTETPPSPAHSRRR
jgi:tetratricopeptide (TPR) repeat protein